MSRFRDEVGIIPGPAWLLAVLFYACVVTLAWTQMPHDPNMRLWAPWQKALFAFGIALFVFVYVLLVGYVYSDAKRRGMRHVMWTLLAAFIPDGIGIILYFLLRDAMPAPCPACGIVARGAFSFCPRCGAPLRPCCPRCGKALEPGWVNCAYCGSKLP